MSEKTTLKLSIFRNLLSGEYLKDVEKGYQIKKTVYGIVLIGQTILMTN